jgi:hypothetical protein
MKAIERSSEKGYWYYAISRVTANPERPEVAKQGFKCSQLSGFVTSASVTADVGSWGEFGHCNPTF